MSGEIIPAQITFQIPCHIFVEFPMIENIECLNLTAIEIVAVNIPFEFNLL
jgi:hypothetical protein